MWTLATVSVWSVKTVNEMIEERESRDRRQYFQRQVSSCRKQTVEDAKFNDGSQNGKETENERTESSIIHFGSSFCFWMFSIIAFLSSEKKLVSWLPVESTGRVPATDFLKYLEWFLLRLPSLLRRICHLWGVGDSDVEKFMFLS